MRVVVKAPAKINLTLDIVGKRDDGYHLLQSVMQSVDLCDRVTVSNDNTGKGIRVECGGDSPVIENNIAHTAARKFFEASGIKPQDISVKIEKKIPVSAGLGGGSADAAAVLFALDKMYDHNLTKEDMLKLASEIGADVPFCLSGGTAFTEGIGGIISPMNNLPECYLVLVKPGEKLSTAEMYKKFDNEPSDLKVENKKFSHAVQRGNLNEIGNYTGNVFEKYAPVETTEKIHGIMQKCGATGCSLTGSGPTFFGIFESHSDASSCAEILKKEFNKVYIAQPKNCGCEIEK